MAANALQINRLPRRNATEVKNKWGDLVREVRARGQVAITQHGKVEMVLLDADHYREMMARIQGVEKRNRTALAELGAEFDRHLATLQAPKARKKAEAAMKSRGRVSPRPKAGMSF